MQREGENPRVIVAGLDPGQLTLFQAASTSKANRTRVSTNTLSHRVGVQRWANFIAGFSVEFVQECLASLDSWRFLDD